jgi:hypothetical protein
VVPPIPFGEGNLPLFEEVEIVLDEGKPLYIVDLAGVPERDYSGGKAVALLRRLLEKGASGVERVEDLAQMIKRGGGEQDD